MKTTVATTRVEVNCYCPNCDTIINIFDPQADPYDEVVEVFNYRGEMRADACDTEVICSSCGEEFIVTDIEF